MGCPVNKIIRCEAGAKWLLDPNKIYEMVSAVGNPWMIYQTDRYLETGELVEEPNACQKIDVCLLRFSRLMVLKCENVAVREMRKQAAWYLKGIRGNEEVRKLINGTETAAELTSLLNGFVDEVMECDQVAVGASAV